MRILCRSVDLVVRPAEQSVTRDIETRLQLARERLSQLKGESDAYLADARKRGTGGIIPGTILATIAIQPLDPPSPRLAALAGEVVYHLRSALDFAVYAAAVVDSGKPQENTQFPIISHEED